MEEIIEFFLKPLFNFLVFLFRIVFFVVWEVLPEYLGWIIGWLTCRLLTFGNYPKEGLQNYSETPIITKIFVTFIGIIIFLLITIGILQMIA